MAGTVPCSQVCRQAIYRRRALTALLIVLAIGFAWSIGAHYTGAVMGMPHALRAIGAWPALLLMAPLEFLGATFASHAVERRVGSGLTAVPLSVERQVVVIGVAFAVTTFFNRFRMPTSTIQILVFSIVGVSLATGVGVNWGAIGHLIDVWFDSGCMPFAQWHAPFENEDRYEGGYPADFVCEALDQTRGWFYSLL